MSEWKATTLGEFISLQRGHDLSYRERKAGTIPVIGSGGIVGFHDRAVVSGPGITIGRAANLGIPTLIQGDFWPLNTTLYVTDFHGNDVRFAYYLLQTLDLTRFNSGSVQPMLNRNYIREVPISIPGRNEQEGISAALGALDEKIAVNDRVAETCLDLALAKYEAAVLEGKFGRIASMAESADWFSGGTPDTSESAYWAGEIPWISALSLKSPWIDDSDRKVTILGTKNGARLVPKDTVIFVVRGSSLDSEFRIGLTRREVSFGQDCKALRATDGIDPCILFLAIKSRASEILQLVDHTGHGAGRLSTDLLAKVQLNFPDLRQSAEVAAEFRALVDIGAVRRVESRNLQALRDTLLPRLMSGEIRLRDAEKVVEDVT